VTESRSSNTTRNFALVFAALFVCAIYAGSPNFRWTEHRESPYAGDFLQEWIGGRILLAGNGEKLYTPGYAESLEHDSDLIGHTWTESKYFPMVYPPFYYAAMQPLAAMPLRLAAWVWALFLSTVFLLTLWGMGKWLLPNATGLTLLILPLVTLSPPVIESLSSGQKGTLLLAVFAATFWLFSAKREWIAGAVFGLVACKPHLGLVLGIVMLATGHWRFVLGALSMCLGLLVFGGLFGWTLYTDYVQLALGSTNYLETSGYNLAKSHSLLAGCKLVFGSGSAAVAWACCAFGVVAAIILIIREKGIEKSFSAIVLATILLSPHLYTYDLTLLVLPLALSVYGASHGNAKDKWLACAYAILLFGSTALIHLSVAMGMPFIALAMLSLLAGEAIATDCVRSTFTSGATPSTLKT
jgi:hypothetical protein